MKHKIRFKRSGFLFMVIRTLMVRNLYSTKVVLFVQLDTNIIL